LNELLICFEKLPLSSKNIIVCENFKSVILFCSFVVFSLQSLKEKFVHFKVMKMAFLGAYFGHGVCWLELFTIIQRRLVWVQNPGVFEFPLFRLVIEFF